MADKNTHYESTCKYYDGGVILCKVCDEWDDKVDKTIQEHGVDEFTVVTKSKRFNRHKHNKK